MSDDDGVISWVLLQFSTWTKISGGSSLQSAGGLDVNELSQKLATIPLEGVEPSDTSSTAPMFGSEVDGECVCVCVCVCVRACVRVRAHAFY